MSSWPEVTKYLRLTQVLKATPEQLYAAQQLSGSSNPAKYLEIVPARAVKLLTGYIILPPFVPSVFDSPDQNKMRGRLLFQYNVSAPDEFYILNAPQYNSMQDGVLCVKYRVGREVFRYAIYGKMTGLFGNQYGPFNTLYFPWYNNELIQPNCVFEYWYNLERKTPPQFRHVEYGLPNGYSVNMSDLFIPCSPDDTGAIINDDALYAIPDLGNTLPITLPVNQDNLVWLDNDLTDEP